MTVLAIVGSVEGAFKNDNMVHSAKSLIFWYLGSRSVEENLVISGGATGVDTWGIEIAQEFGFQFREYTPAHNRWEPNGFKERNLKIAHTCDELLCVRSRFSTTYGSGWTADTAHRLGKRVYRYVVG